MRYCRRGIREGNPSTPSKPMVRKRLWSPEEDNKLTSYIMENGLLGCWNFVAKQAGIQRSGKSCRLRWINYLRPDLKRGAFSYEEELLIIHLQSALGNRWSLIAAELPGRTDNELKNYWNTCIKKKIMLKHQLSSSTNTNTESNIPSQCNTKSVPAQAHDTFTSSDSAQLYLDFLPEGSQLPYNNFNVVTTTGENRFYVPNLLELEYGQVQTQSDHEFLIDPDPTNIQHISYSPLWINDSYIHTHKSFTSHPAFVAPSLPAYKESCRTIVPPAEAPHSAYGCLGSREFTIPALLGNEWWKEKTENDKNQMMIDYSNAWSAGHSYSNAAECTHVVDPGAYTACDEGISIMEDSDSLYDITFIGFDKPSI